MTIEPPLKINSGVGNPAIAELTLAVATIAMLAAIVAALRS